MLRDLPEKTEQTIYCDLSGSQRKQYNELRDFYRASLSERIEKSGLARAKIHVLEALLSACARRLSRHAKLMYEQTGDLVRGQA